MDRRAFLTRFASISVGLVAAPAVYSSTEGQKHQQHQPRMAMLVDLRKCVGCQACTVGCSIENQPPLGQFRTTVNQYEVTSDEDHSAFFMMPRLCNHCEDAPCIPVCPTGATFQEDNGVVVVDNEHCVGCGYCVQACPYDARFVNKETNVADKCTFCLHRLEVGLLPACVETCVGGARLLGDIHDPESEISKLLQEHKDDISVLKPEAKTNPHNFYIGLNELFQSQVGGEAPPRKIIAQTGEALHDDH